MPVHQQLVHRHGSFWCALLSLSDESILHEPDLRLLNYSLLCNAQSQEGLPQSASVSSQAVAKHA